MATSTRQLLAESFSQVHGYLIGLLGLAFSIVSWLIPVNANSTVLVVTVLRWATPALVTVLLAVAVLIQTLSSMRRVSQLPRVLHGRMGPASSDGGASALLLLEKSDLYGHDVVVSVYYMDESDFEELVGVGYVRNIQVDGKIQVLLNQVVANNGVVEKLTGNDAGVLKRLRVKPSAPHEYMP